MEREFYELTITEREKVVERVDEILSNEFQISQNSINEFWSIFVAGQHKAEIA